MRGSDDATCASSMTYPTKLGRRQKPQIFNPRSRNNLSLTGESVVRKRQLQSAPVCIGIIDRHLDMAQC